MGLSNSSYLGNYIQPFSTSMIMGERVNFLLTTSGRTWSALAKGPTKKGRDFPRSWIPWNQAFLAESPITVYEMKQLKSI